MTKCRQRKAISGVRGMEAQFLHCKGEVGRKRNYKLADQLGTAAPAQAKILNKIIK